MSACPDCRERIRIEQLSHGWSFCAGCGLSWSVNAEGVVVRTLTNHSPLYSARTCAHSTETRAADV